MSHLFKERLRALQQHLQPHQAIILSDPKDILYFSGFETLVPEEREAFLVLTVDQGYLLYASFSPLPAHTPLTTLAGCDPGSVLRHLQHLQTTHQLSELLVDTTKIFVHEYEALQKVSACRLITLDKLWTWKIRVIKDQAEQTAIRHAASIASQAFQTVQKEIKVGQTEQDVQDLLEQAMRQLGSRVPAFPTIVAFGPHGALPHHQPSSQTILKEEMAILLDFGATYEHYRSDMTRSWWFGQYPPEAFLKVSDIVTNAYQAAMQQAKEQEVTSLSAADLDKAARQLITEAGFGEQFIHTTGHGVGLDIHEPPSISGRNLTLLKPGMVITIEPGIYLEGQFGYRYENTVLVTETGLQELTTSDTIS